MRKVDPRTPISRRSFVRGAATVAPVALAAGGTAVSVGEAWAEGGKALSPDTLKTLVLVARDIYPHDHLTDLYYQNAILPWDGKAEKDPAVRAMLEKGVATLDAAAKAKHGRPYLGLAWEDDRVPLLKGIETSDFFKALRADLVVSLYNQKPLWRKFGYEGASADKGGYIERGFSDIDWLES